MEKALQEKRNALVEEMEGLVKTIKAETRAFNETETARMEAIKTEVAGIDNTIKVLEETRSMEKKEIVEKKEEQRSAEQIDNEELRGIFEKRDAMNTVTNAQGGFVVNKQLTGAIIKTLKDRSNVFGFFNSTTIPGIARLPKKASNGIATWADEQLVPNGTSAAVIPTLDILELGQNRLYRESALTQQMLNVEEIDLRSFIIDDISESMADAIEDAIFNGTGTKQPTGLLGEINANKKISLATRGTITVDDLKKCKAKLKKEAQMKAKWFMNSDTLLQIDLLKDGNGQYILHQDITTASGYTLLGLPVEVTDVMPTLADTGAKCVVVLATAEAYHTNMQKSLALYIYDDSTYKRAGLVGFGSDMYIDGKVKNDDVLAGIFNKSA